MSGINCVITDNRVFGAEILNCQSGSILENCNFVNNGDISSSGLTGGLYLENSSPDITQCYFTSNKGAAIVANDRSHAIIGGGIERYGNEFENNEGNQSLNTIIYEMHNSYPVYDNRYNNLYLGDLETFIHNTTQNFLRYIRYNYWGSETGPTGEEFYPPNEMYLWEWNPFGESPYSIGGNPEGLGGGGSGEGLEAGLYLEGQGEYVAAVEAYQSFIDSTNNSIKKQIAMSRILSSSIAGNLELEPLLNYYQSFILGGPSLTSAANDSDVVRTALRLKSSTKEHLGNYLSAILDYETMLTNNPTVEDSVYAVIHAGYAYLKMNDQGGIPSSISSSPQMPELEPVDWLEFEEHRWELLNQFILGNGIAGGGADGIIRIPENFALHQNYPNPFNPETVIRYDLPELSEVRIEIFNILGQRVCTLIDGFESAGYKSVSWEGTNEDGLALSSGIYVYSIYAEGLASGTKYTQSSKMLLLQ